MSLSGRSPDGFHCVVRRVAPEFEKIMNVEEIDESDGTRLGSSAPLGGKRCPECDGTGNLSMMVCDPFAPDCPTCEGTGERREERPERPA